MHLVLSQNLEIRYKNNFYIVIVFGEEVARFKHADDLLDYIFKVVKENEGIV